MIKNWMSEIVLLYRVNLGVLVTLVRKEKEDYRVKLDLKVRSVSPFKRTELKAEFFTQYK